MRGFQAIFKSANIGEAVRRSSSTSMQMGWGGSIQATSKVIREEIVTASCVFSMYFESAKLVFRCDEIGIFYKNHNSFLI